jgi:hypothetical protein
MLDPEVGVPMADLEGKVFFYEGPQDKGKFKAFIRMSPNRFLKLTMGASLWICFKGKGFSGVPSG